MILAANQPYFLPYLGYFQLINSVNQFLILDDFQYEKGGWINRNRIMRDGRIHYVTLSLHHSSPHKAIAAHEIIKNMDIINRSVESAYSKAQNFKLISPLIQSILNFPERRLNYFLLNSLQIVCDYLGITTPLILNSERNEPTDLRGEQRVIHICKSMKVETYINAFGGQELYSRENFAREGITLKFIKPQLRAYKQIRTQEFVPALSILDVMMNVSRDEIRDMLNDYTLI